jgi:hypothetical protein
MMKKLLFEAPIDDYLDPKAKETLLKAQNKKYQNAKEAGGSNNNMSTLMYYLPQLESEHKSELLELAKSIFLYKFPKIKERVEKGLVTLDVNFSTNSTVRSTPQTISPETFEKAKEVDPNFEERIKARNFINATTQGSAWAEGFNMYKEIESELKEINPDLLEKYKQFENSATVFYNDNLDTLEKMAKQSLGRVAFADVVPDEEKPGNWVIKVRAPHFPLLMHELQKAGRYYNSLLFLPKDKSVSNTLKKITDVHKHEIRNMITGREISSKLKFLWSELIDGYESWMDSMIQTQFNKLANDNPKLFNRIMYEGVIGNNPEAMDEFEEITQIIVDSIKKNTPKVEKPDYKKMITKKPEPITPDEDEYDNDDFNPDDWDDFNIDDEDED